jgi:K+-sensing histidine kinase KdpD
VQYRTVAIAPMLAEVTPSTLSKSETNVAFGVTSSALNHDIQLLVPIRRATDVIFGARYANMLKKNGKQVKVSLLHVNRPRRDESSPHSFSANVNVLEEAQAEALLKEAALFLNEHDIAHRTYIMSGDVVFSILDAAELLNCQEIILPSAKRRSWLRPFSSGIIGKIVQSKRGMAVHLVDQDGKITHSSNSNHKMQKSIAASPDMSA